MKKCQPRALTPYLDGELSEDLHQEIAEHLKSCPTCGILLDEISAAREQVRSMGRADISGSALEPALKVFSERAGLAREPAMAQAPRVEADLEMSAVAAGQLESPALTSDPVSNIPTTSLFEWSDPPNLPAGDASAISAYAEPERNLGDEEAAMKADRAEELPEHPIPPPPHIRPPWMDAAGDEDEDLEEAGRRAVDEAILAAEEPGPVATLDDAPPSFEVAAEPEAAAVEAPPPAMVREDIRGPRRESRDGDGDRTSSSTGGLGSLNTQLRIGLVSALVLIALVAAILFTGKTARQVPTASNKPNPTRHAAPSPAARPTQTTAPSPATAQPAIPQLTEVATAGSGGSSWRVLRVRVGSPGGGTTRVVFDLEGSGPRPDARLGRGPDGAIYLTASGITISPADLGNFGPIGPISGVTQVAPSGLALKFATTGSPGFSIGYLGTPNRLFLDFK